ncbi:MAG TPA: hypothetical protein VLL08_22510, partial [Kineosporiaceae bacterium]|nr:hypothetical protein [Kineosporiaceae bacterium]
MQRPRYPGRLPAPEPSSAGLADQALLSGLPFELLLSDVEHFMSQIALHDVLNPRSPAALPVLNLCVLVVSRGAGQSRWAR